MIQSHHHYQRYQLFIDALKGQSVDGYAEVHHIVPRSLGGSDDASNLIRLTARQHYIAHWMLWKAYGGIAGRSFYMMSNLGKYGKVNSATYAQARENYSEQVKKQMAVKPNVPAFTPEHREKLRQAKLGRKLSEETKRKVGAAGCGRKASEETRRKISEAKRGIATRGTGWKHSEETRKKMTESQYARNLKWLAEGNESLPADEV
jgi:hypothetical protein